jgi:mono/diheme cytochrome c family protein
VFRRIAYLVEAAVAVVFVVTVVLLFTNKPTETSPTQAAAPVDAYGLPVGTAGDGAAVAPGPDGAAIFDRRCASCHGNDGSGLVGPALNNGQMVERFPDAADQIAVVTNGRGEMPSFFDRLTPEEIAAVVEYTRTGLVSG